MALNNLSPNQTSFKNSQRAWETLNESFFNQVVDLIQYRGATRNGTELEVNDVFIHIKRAWVNPHIDFGNYFGYKKQKWNSLVNNYVDKIELERVKKEITSKEDSKNKSYNISMQFVNNHGHGKNCLLALTFSRRKNYDRPILSVTLRASEITKRLLLDLLLIQRIAEKVYGRKKKVSINLFVIKMYQNAEAFTMYHNHRPFSKFNYSKGHEYQLKVMSILDKFLTCDIDDIKYKVHKRSVRQLQRDKKGKPLSGWHPMLAKELKL